MADENKIGFFNKQKSHSSEFDYKSGVPFNKTDTETTPAPEQTSLKSGSKKDVRKTIRVPEQQYFELNALLELSANKYMYELLAELVDSQVKEMSKNNPDTLRAYQEIISRQKLTSQRKQ
ncbi:hypothetical protein [uncultured Secundilactobacillus sp.]|uniref:hypothetical protein n=1 Tax=uncultured Secundilactobacillus sp. TaxID=2813935 RepID=UPI00258F8D64|nr:hypothetical protein [uncultured Secundilactobacillus sp.]